MRSPRRDPKRSPRRDPKYRRHKQSGQAIVTLSYGPGRRQDVLLGKYGTDESKAEYRRRIAEWRAGQSRFSQSGAPPPDLSVNEVILAYWREVETYYRHQDGTPTSEVKNIRLALRPLRQLYGHTAAADFDSLALETVRQEMIKRGLCRGRVNKDVARIKRLFKWASSKRKVPLSAYQSLLTLEGLRAGRSAAREAPPVKPVSIAAVEATLPYLRPQVAALVQIQLHSGMRPGEVTIMRAIDIDMSGPVWIYRPGSDSGPCGRHKNAWRGLRREVALGPKAQAVLRPWLRLNVQEYLFQPKEAEADRDVERRAKRKTPVQPSQAKRRPKAHPKRQPGDYYTVVNYHHAIQQACDRAFPPPEPLARRADETAREWRRRLTPEQKEEIREWRRQHRWHPNQLRHTKATEIRREAGLDAARVILGHRSAQTSEIYAEIDGQRAIEVMARLG